jgi:hypothetical protein
VEDGDSDTEDDCDADRLATKTGKFPVILEDVGEITTQDGDIYAEVLQEFSRVRFPTQHENTVQPGRLGNQGKGRSPSGHTSPTVKVEAGSTRKLEITNAMRDRITEVFHAATEHQLAEMKAGKLKYTEKDIPRLRERWMELSVDIMSGVPEKMPPLRAVNHRIPLIDEKKSYHYHLPRCPDAMKEQLIDKINRYVRAGWWKAVQTDQAAPMLCIPKKTGLLRTAIDCRKRNENTLKDVTPFPDQDQIRMDCARAKYRSKIDMSDAYEQIRIIGEDVWKTAFATVYGTFVSHTMQIGDCNAPATFQRIMTMVFQEFIGRFVHVYLDDIFIYSNSIEEHERHLGQVFDTLRKNDFYLKKEKCDLYSKRMDCLGHVIDDRGLHADADKMQRIREW